MQRPIERAWELQQQWSTAATAAHDRIERLRNANLVLLVAAAVTGATAGLLHEQSTAVRVLSVIGAVLLGIAGLVQQRFLGKTRVADWVGTRLASERLKSAVWRTLGLGHDDETSRTPMLVAIELAEREVVSRGEALDSGDVKPLPTVTSVIDYAQQRAVKQAAWHTNKAEGFHRRSRFFRSVELATTLVGIAVSAIAAAYTEVALSPVVAAITTIAAALAAHLAASKYEGIAAGYESTASRLTTLSEVLPESPTPDEAALFVDDVERVLAEQNAQWLTVLSTD